MITHPTQIAFFFATRRLDLRARTVDDVDSHRTPTTRLTATSCRMIAH